MHRDAMDIYRLIWDTDMVQKCPKYSKKIKIL